MEKTNVFLILLVLPRDHNVQKFWKLAKNFFFYTCLLKAMFILSSFKQTCSNYIIYILRCF